jgi:hypothetical protein
MSNNVLSQLSCPQCGAPLDIRNASTQAVVCARCQAYVAIGAESASVLASGKNFTPGTPIKIGSTGILNGTRFFVLGHVQYEGWDPKDLSDRWKWDEYLLGGEDGRLLWLSHDENGFGLYTKQRLTGEFSIRTSSSIPTRDGKKIAVHERYPAKIVGARGELTWQARPGDTLYMAEGAGGGKRYSVQQSDDELEIYEGAPLDTLTVAKAFGDEAWIKRVKGSKARKQFAGLVARLCIIFAVIGILMAIFFEGGGEQILRESFEVSEAVDTFSYTIHLDQSNRPAIVSLETVPLPVNTYAGFDVNVTSPNGVITELFETVMWREIGSDSDGPWDESEYQISNMFVPTVTGEHTLEIVMDEESTAPLPLQVTLTVRRNHITPLWLVVYAVVVGVIGGAALLGSFK